MNLLPTGKYPKYAMPLMVVLLALSMRGVVLIFAPCERPFEKYLILGQQLLDNSFIANQPFAYSPLYCYFIAFSKAIFGNFLPGILFLQILVGAMTCLLIFGIARRIFGIYVAWVCVSMAILCRSFILYELTFLSDFLGLFLQIALAASLYWVWDQKKSLAWGLPGILLGLSILQRPNALFLFVLLLPLLYLQKPSWAFFGKKLLILSMSVGIILLPIVIQNARTMGEPGITASNPGYIFYSSHNFKNVGVLYHPPHVLLQREAVQQENRQKGKEKSRYSVPFEGDAEMATEISSAIAGHTMTRQESSQFYMRYAWRFLTQYPLEAAALFLQKLWFMVHAYEAHDSLPAMIYYPKIEPFTPLRYGWIIPFGLVGLFCSFTDWRRFWPLYLILGSQALMMFLFYVVERFRLPIEGTFILFAGILFQKMYLAFEAKKGKTIFWLLCSLTLAFIFCNTMNSDMKEHTKETAVDSHFTIASMAYKRNQLPEAFENFSAVLAIEDPLSSRALESYRSLAQIFGKIGLKKERELALQKASVPLEKIMAGLEAYRNQGSITFHQRRGLAELYQKQNHLAKAQTLLEEALQEKPSHPDVRYELGRLAHQKGEHTKAEEYYKTALEDGLLFTEKGLHGAYYLAEILHQKKRPEEAKRYYLQALRQQAFLVWYGMNPEVQKIGESLKEWRSH